MEYNKDYETVLEEMQGKIDGDISKGEGTLVNFALAPAAAEFEELYSNLEVADENSSPLSCDRDHLLVFGSDDNIPVKEATAAVWLATFNEDFEVGERFEAGDLTYISTQRVGEGKYYLTCETTGAEGNTKPDDELLPIEFISETIEGELTELIEEATDDEETEVYRARYLAEKKSGNNMAGNRAAYKKIITSLSGVAAVKMVRVTDTKKRIDAYILSSSYGKPIDEVVSAVQEVIDPIGQQGDGAGQAPWWHVVDVLPVEETTIDISAKFTLDGVEFEDIKESIEAAVDEYFVDLNKTWEDETNLIVRALRIAEKMGGVDGVIDVQDLLLNGSEDNITIGTYAIPVRGVIKNVN
jgi:uncharacterized phage protein gp47/JayE